MLLSVGVLAVSFAAIFVRYAQAAGMPVLIIAAWRLLFASAILVPYACMTHGREIRMLARRDWGFLVAAGICLGLHFATWIGSLAYTSVAHSAVLVATGPVFVALGSWLLLGEKPKPCVWIGLGCAVCGSVVMCHNDLEQGQHSWLGSLLALTGALCVAGYFLIGRRVRQQKSLVVYIAPVYMAAMLTLVLLVLMSGRPLVGYSWTAYGWVLILGLFPQLVGHSTLNWALGFLSASLVSIVTLAEPIGSTWLAYLLLDEQLEAVQVAGGVLILIGIYLAMRN